MTLGDCFNKVLKLLNYYSSGGTPIASSDGAQADLFARAAALIDTAQIEVSAVHPIYRTASIACTRIINRINGRGLHHVGTSALTFELPAATDAELAHALSFATGDALTAVVTQMKNGSATILTTQNTVAAASMTAYRAVFSPAAGASEIRVSFSGSPGNVADVALYREIFANAAMVPVFGIYRDHALPSDFRAVSDLTLRPAAGNVRRGARDYLLRDRAIALPWDFDGEALLTYAAFPAPVTDATARTAALTVDDAAAQAIVYYAAAGLVAEENPTLEGRFLSLYRQLLSDVPVARSVGGITPAFYTAPVSKLR